MPPTIESLGLDGLPREERLALVQALWDSIAREEPVFPMPRPGGANWSDGRTRTMPRPTT